MTYIYVKIARNGRVAPAPISFELSKPVVLRLKILLVSNLFLDVAPLSMRVYASLAAFEARQELADDQSLVGFGDEQNPLVAWRPTSAASCMPPSRPHDSTREWTLRFEETRLAADQLPPVSQLRAFVETALPVKIPIASTAFSRLAAAGPALLDKLFTVDDTAPCTDFYMDVVNLVLNPVEAARSKASFIAYWSCLIQRPVTSTVSRLRFNRHKKSSDMLQRPDFVSTLHRVCVFRGEEESPEADLMVSRDELVKNMMWAYGSTPYILAYATSGYECALYALVAGVGRQVDTVEIAFFRTDREKDRLRLLLTLLQLTRLFEGIVGSCPETSFDEYCDIVCPNGTVVSLDQRRVAKRFPADARQFELGAQLETVYRVIRDHGVPHTDMLVKSNWLENAFVFEPRGTETKPANLDELFIAIRHVLEALVVLHKAEWMHRDLRWPNVIKRRDVRNQWFLIDFVDAAPSPKQNSRFEILSTHSHAPEIFIDGGSHTTAVDMWGVGALIDTSDFDGEQWCHRAERMEFLLRLLANEPALRPSASEALAEVERLDAARTSA